MEQNGQMQKCVKCASCPPGYGAIRRCTQHNNTVCMACPPGMYSSWHSPYDACLPCKICNAHRTIVRVCNKSQDRVCSTCNQGYYEDFSTGTCKECDYCYHHDFTQIRKAACQYEGAPVDFYCTPSLDPPYRAPMKWQLTTKSADEATSPQSIISTSEWLSWSRMSTLTEQPTSFQESRVSANENLMREKLSTTTDTTISTVSSTIINRFLQWTYITSHIRPTMRTGALGHTSNVGVVGNTVTAGTPEYRYTKSAGVLKHTAIAGAAESQVTNHIKTTFQLESVSDRLSIEIATVIAIILCIFIILTVFIGQIFRPIRRNRYFHKLSDEENISVL
ncbi:uncharacterized protein LOC117118648 isoform X2 [Anneissia japonica]|nr:uncharacterized protein LOC117118648 isoform X2 [Anneissia japonica]